jgi:S1-C subfamily serine protease
MRLTIALVVVVIVLVGMRRLRSGTGAGGRRFSPNGKLRAAANAEIRQDLASRESLIAQFGSGITPDALPRPFGVTFAEDPTAPDGLFVLSVDPRSPAARVGLAAGDTVSTIDGIAVRSVETAEEVLDAHKPGIPVFLVWERDGKERRGDIVL